MKHETLSAYQRRFKALLGLLLAIVVALQSPQAALSTGSSSQPQVKISQPYTHKNLAIFLVYAPDQIRGKSYLTLQEAMQQKRVIVHETGSVNELAIENVSGDSDVYVQSGDIVKGGRQDRVLITDLIVPPRSGRIPINSFCVEQGRWQKRGQESSDRFSASSALLATKDLKLAAKQKGEQQEVWRNVALAQEKLSGVVGAGEGGGSSVQVRAAQSPSSLQLTLESAPVQEATDSYVKALAGIIEGKSDVIGYAFAINGKLNSAEVYASSALFRKLWPKLLKATAVEAVSEPAKASAALPEEAVKAFLADIEKGKASEKIITSRTKTVTLETDKLLMFESRDQQEKEQWVHRSYIVK